VGEKGFETITQFWNRFEACHLDLMLPHIPSILFLLKFRSSSLACGQFSFVVGKDS
jgi:hypothetical protein